MKTIKALLILSFFTFFLGCSTNTDSNGNATTTVAPLAPNNLSGSNVANQVVLTWTDNSTNETGFKIDRKTAAGSWVEIGSVASNIVTYSDAAITLGTTYSYRVYSFNSLGNSLNYSNEFIIIIPTITALSNVTICNQIWTTKNLDVTTYSDGTVIPQVTDPTQWANLTTGAWCYYNNDPANNAVYGKLYNWYAAVGIYNAASLSNPALRKKLAPTGWHVPTDAEWTVLTDCLGGVVVTGGKMKESGTTHWQSPNTGATNSSGFTGLPGGYRNNDGTFFSIPRYGYWWSSSETGYVTPSAHSRNLNYDGGLIYIGYYVYSLGYSVRCLRD